MRTLHYTSGEVADSRSDPTFFVSQSELRLFLTTGKVEYGRNRYKEKRRLVAESVLN